MIILIALLISGVIGMILGPVVFGAIKPMPGSDLVLGILPSLFPQGDSSGRCCCTTCPRIVRHAPDRTPAPQALPWRSEKLGRAVARVFFFVADWHALTTHYDDPSMIPQSTWDMVIDWLAAGVNPGEATLFVQSRVPEHAELHLLLSMITPLGWLERVPTYKDQQERLKEKDLSTYGFLGYPLPQSADILVYRAGLVPAGEDQVVHVELTREVARRFNHIYGREPDFEDKAEQAIGKMGKERALYHGYRRSFQEQGDEEAPSGAALLSRNRISASSTGTACSATSRGGMVILPEPQPLLTKAAKMPGLDGQKMSKSYGNTIALDASPADVEKQMRTMPTDPARVRRTDPSNPEICPVWQFHQVYSDEAVRTGCNRVAGPPASVASECKQPVIDAVLAELKPIQERGREYAAQPDLVHNIVNEGCERAREVARDDGRGASCDVARLLTSRTIFLDRTTGRSRRATTAGNAVRRGAGQPQYALPKDLYIPPDALEVFRCLRRPARSAAVPDTAAESRHPRYPDRRHHATVHGSTSS